MLTPETLAQVAELEEEKMTDDGKATTEEEKDRIESVNEGDETPNKKDILDALEERMVELSWTEVLAEHKSRNGMEEKLSDTLKLDIC